MLQVQNWKRRVTPGIIALTLCPSKNSVCAAFHGHLLAQITDASYVLNTHLSVEYTNNV